MSQPYISGPVHIYVGVVGGITGNVVIADTGTKGEGSEEVDEGLFLSANINSYTPAYLGTCQEAPKIRTNTSWAPIVNELWGNQEPYDVTYQGSYCDIYGALTKWDWNVYTRCQCRPNSLGGLWGQDDLLSVGTMMVTEGFAYPIWLYFPYYQNKLIFINNGAPPVYRFWAGFLVGPEEENLGTKPNSINIQFRCMRKFNPVSRKFVLVDRVANGAFLNDLNTQRPSGGGTL